jgi:pimeloyl-ACP methyl ester carboxylesterase
LAVPLFWLGLGLTCSVPVAVAVYLVVLHYRLRWKYLHLVERIFQEKPLFIIPRGQPDGRAEEVSFRTPEGLTLRGCYWRTPLPRRGVILFGLEYGSNRWSCRPYCEHLVNAGFDVFAFERRNQGDSEALPGYEPLQWVTDHEVRDTEAALAYLKARPDADPRGVGFFGISKGGGAGLIAASRDPYVRCCVTDGAFGTYTTLVPYMRHWFHIYNGHRMRQAVIPSWYFGAIGRVALRRVARQRRCRFPDLERAVPRLAPRPLLIIHGGADTYIKPDMARALFAHAQAPRELWLVDDAKHNQALQVAGDEYRRRVLAFFEEHLAAAPAPTPAAAPSACSARAPEGIEGSGARGRLLQTTRPPHTRPLSPASGAQRRKG